MVDRWEGERAGNDRYEFEFTTQRGKRVVRVFEVERIIRTGASTRTARVKGRPLETRELPLEGQEGRDLTDRFLGDLDAEQRSLIVARLCHR